jgi:hypothetical protein
MGPIAYGTKIGQLQIFGYLLVFIASVPAAGAILGSRNEYETAQVKRLTAATR